jgi:hypothetical protein
VRPARALLPRGVLRANAPWRFGIPPGDSNSCARGQRDRDSSALRTRPTGPMLDP